VLPSFVDSYIGGTVSNYLQKIRNYYTTENYITLIKALTELYFTPTQTFQLAEWHIYGSSRVGIYKANKPLKYIVDETVTSYTYQTRVKERYNGKKQYELSNHLGNVLVTISDRRTAICNEVDSTLRYEAVVVTATDFYSFGSPLIGRSYEANISNGYRFSFNGKEKTDEIYGDGNGVDFGDRIYDPRIGRWLSLDPMMAKYSAWSPYNYTANSPILLKDIKGKYWDISTVIDDKGNTTVFIKVTAAVLNSGENQARDMDKFAETVKTQIESAYTFGLCEGDKCYNVVTKVDIRAIDDKSELAENEHLFEIVPKTDADVKPAEPKPGEATPTTGTAGIALTGTYIKINEEYVDGMMKGKNIKTIPHELGHTGGLGHPSPAFQTIITNLPIPTIVGTVQIPVKVEKTKQHEDNLFSEVDKEAEKKTNIMYQGGTNYRYTLVKKQIEIIKDNFKNGKLNDNTKHPPLN
jgi:RHS repeat-associated protein